MYLISKDEYDSFQRNKNDCVYRSGISDSNVNHIDVSHGGNITIHSLSADENERRGSSPALSGSSRSQLPVASLPRQQGIGRGTRPAKVRESYGQSSSSAPAPPSSSSGQNGGRGSRRSQTQLADPESVYFVDKPQPRIEPMEVEYPPGPEPMDYQSQTGTTTQKKGRVKRDTTLSPAPVDLRRNALQNAAAMAKREKVMMQQLVEERADQLSGRRRRRDPRGEERELLHDLRDANQNREQSGKRRRQEESDSPAAPLPAVGAPSMNMAKKHAKSRRSAASRPVFSPAVAPPPVQTVSATKRSANWEREYEEEEASRRKRMRPTKVEYLGRSVAGKKRPYLSDWEEEEGGREKRGRRGPSPVRVTLAGGKRRAAEDYADEDPFHYEPQRKKQDVHYAPVRHVGRYAGVKRKKTSLDWEEAELDDADVLPPSKRHPEV